MKRAFDILLALLSLPFAFPVIVFCGILVRATSEGPAIFKQKRVGRHESIFTCYKLRTMFSETRDAPSHETSATSVTPLGRYLRRLKIDELPQLFNVLRGEMSFVGPRPSLPTQQELIAARRRNGLFEIRPGITGVSQVAGIDMSNPELLAERDAQYLDDMSLATDLKLIAVTLFGAGRGDRIKL
jgi:O-antigen biosynthesis protein WbqP